MSKRAKKTKRAGRKKAGGNRPVHNTTPTVDLSVRIPLTKPELAAFERQRGQAGIQRNRLIRFLVLGWTKGLYKVKV